MSTEFVAVNLYDIKILIDYIFNLLLRFIGQVDKIGCAFEAPAMATGFGAYLALVSYSLFSVSS